MISIPFRYIKHLVSFPVVVGPTNSSFAFDTGVGITCLSSVLAERAGWLANGETFTGRRMSGQEITAPLGSIPSLSLGNYQREDLVVAVFDIGEVAGLDPIEGFLGLDFFRSAAVTFDYPAGQIVIEDVDSLAARAKAGTSVTIDLHLDERIVEVFLSLDIAGRRVISVEVDTGSDTLILNESLAADTAIDLTSAETRRVQGTDETGHVYTRFFAKLRGEVSVSGGPSISQQDPQVMFQKIIYDGLVGHAFLSHFVVTYDIPGAQMIFAQAG